MFILQFSLKIQTFNKFMGNLFYFCAHDTASMKAHLLVVFCTDLQGTPAVRNTEIRIVCSNLIVIERDDDSKVFGMASSGKNWIIACPAGFKVTQVRPIKFGPID